MTLALRWLIVSLIALPLYCLGARAAVDGVTVALESGEVVGKSRGLGTASLTARISNASGRTIEGIRIAAWYSLVDVLPTADASWQIHEFVFDPALVSGGSTTLSFTDDNAAQYVLLEARAVKFRPALRYDGALHDLEHPLLRRGESTFVALRDLISAIGGRLDSRDGYIVIERFGSTLRLRPGDFRAEENGAAHQMDNPILEESGRSYIALPAAASLFNLQLTQAGPDAWELK